MRLVAFQRGILRLASSRPTIPVPEVEFIRFLGPQAGVWLFKKYSRLYKKKPTKWCRFIDALVEACSLHTVDAARLVSIFDHDVKFHQDLTDAHFRFQFQSLHKDVKTAVTVLMEFLYEQFYKESGYGEEIHGTPGLSLNRKTFLASYGLVNRKITVCPVCDQKSDLRELDHFLPKSIYPFLSLHPFNLIPVCKDCNSTEIKGERDPLLNEWKGGPVSDPLPNTFHPYRGRTISDLATIKIMRLLVRSNEFEAFLEENGMSTRRIATAIRVYKLPERWTNRCNGKYGDGILPHLIECLLHQSDIRMQTLPRPTLNDLKASFKSDYAKVGTQGNHVLQDSYLNYAFSDTQETQLLFAAYTNAL